MLACLAACLLAGPVRLDADGVPLPAEAVCRVGSARWRAAGYVPTLDVTPDGRTLISVQRTSDPSDHRKFLAGWDAATGFPLYRVPITGARYRDRLTLPPGTGIARVEYLAEDDTFAVASFDPRTGQSLGPSVVLLPAARDEARLSPGGRYVFEAFKDTVRRYGIDETDHVLSRRLVGGTEAVELIRSPAWFRWEPSLDDKHVAAVVYTNREQVQQVARVYDVATGRPLRELPFDGTRAGDLEFTPDGTAVAGWYGSDDRTRTLGVWEVATGRRRDVVTCPGDSHISNVRYTPDGRRVRDWSYLWDRVLDLDTGRQVCRMPARAGLLAVSPDGFTGYIQNHDSAAAFEPVGSRVGRPSWDRGRDLTPLGFAPDGRLLVRSDWGGRFRVHRCDSVTGEHRSAGAVLPAGTEQWTSVSPDGRLAVMRVGGHPADERPAVVRVLDTDTGGVRATLADHGSSPLEVRFSADGQRLVTAAPDEFRVWDAGTLRRIGGGPLPGYTGHWVPARDPFPIEGMALTANGRRLVGGVYSPGRTDEWAVWDLMTAGTVVRHGPAEAGHYQRFAVSADERLVAAAGGDPRSGRLFWGWEASWVRVWETVSGRLVVSHPLRVAVVSGPAFSPDGRMLAVGIPGALLLLETASGAVRHTFIGHIGNVQEMHFSPDGRHLAAASADAPIFVWDVRGELSKQAAITLEQIAVAIRDLASADAPTAFRAVRLLAHFPNDSLPLLRAAIPPMPPLPAGKVAGLVQQLDSPRYADRQAATRGLAALGRTVEGELRAVVKDSPSPEARRRADELLTKLTNGPPTPDELRAVRAVEAVEWMGTPDARALLRTWAAGGPHARLTTEATAAVGRLP